MGVAAIIKQDLRDSMRYMKDENPALLKIIAIVALFNLLISSLLIIGMPVLIINTLKMSDELLGFAQGYFSASNNGTGFVGNM